MFEPPLKTKNCAVVGWCFLLSQKKLFQFCQSYRLASLLDTPLCLLDTLGWAIVLLLIQWRSSTPSQFFARDLNADPTTVGSCTFPRFIWDEVISPISGFFLRYERTLASLEVGFPLHQPYPYSWCGFLYLHFRYLFKVWWWFLVIWEKKTSFCLVEAMTFSREMTGFHVKGWKTPQLGIQKIGQTAVDGSETQPENQPEVGSLSPVFTRGLLHPRWELSRRISGCNQQFHKCSLGHSPHLPWWNNSWSPYCGMDFESWVPHISSSHSKSKSSLWNQNCEYFSEKN